MNNLLNIKDAFAKPHQDAKDAAARKQEVATADLVSPGGFPTIAKYVVFTVLGIFNVRLFYTVVGVPWGVVISAGSIFQEMFAIYCFNKQFKSEGKHRKALKFFAVAFTALSVIHALASVYEVSGLGPSIGKPLYIYSHFIAPVAIFGLMTVALFVLAFTHWSAKVSEARAESQIAIATSQADLATRESELANKARLAKAELAHQQEILQVEQGMTALLRDTIASEMKKQELLDGIPNPEVRDRIQRFLGVVGGTATPKLPQQQLTSASTEKPPAGFNPPKTTTTGGASNLYFLPADSDPKP